MPVFCYTALPTYVPTYLPTYLPTYYNYKPGACFGVAEAKIEPKNYIQADASKKWPPWNPLMQV